MLDLLAPAILILLGLCWMYSERELFRDGLRSYRWPHVNGRIIDKDEHTFIVPGVVGSAATGIGWVQVRETGYFYEYQVHLNRYTGNMYCFGVQLDQQQAEYLVGDHVQVFYNPNDPKTAVLCRGIQIGTLASTLPVLIGIGAILLKSWWSW